MEISSHLQQALAICGIAICGIAICGKAICGKAMCEICGIAICGITIRGKATYVSRILLHMILGSLKHGISKQTLRTHKFRYYQYLGNDDPIASRLFGVS